MKHARCICVDCEREAEARGAERERRRIRRALLKWIDAPDGDGRQPPWALWTDAVRERVLAATRAPRKATRAGGGK